MNDRRAAWNNCTQTYSSLPIWPMQSIPQLPSTFSFSLLLNALFTHAPPASFKYCCISLSLSPFKASSNMKSTFFTILLSFLLISAAISFATRTEPDGSVEEKSSRKGGRNDDYGMGGGFGPGGGFNIPGFGHVVGGGYGSGFGGPAGGRSKSGIIRNTAVCKEKGPCYNKRLTCPAKCFTSYSRSGKGYGYGGGGGGCTVDCQKKCTAYC